MTQTAAPGTRRAVKLGDGRRIPLGAYVGAWKAAIAAPICQSFKGSPNDPRGDFGAYTRAAVLDEFRAGMHDRINRHLPGFGRGRKWSCDWQRATLQLAHAVNTPRLIVRLHGNPAARAFGGKLAHRLTE